MDNFHYTRNNGGVSFGVTFGGVYTGLVKTLREYVPGLRVTVTKSGREGRGAIEYCPKES
jgi:hypothetical protein